MPTAPEPSSTPDDVYKLFIDTLATETSSSLHAQWVAADGYFSHATGHEPLNHFVASLAAEQRQLLAEMLRDEREAAIHDVLALLSWLIHCHGVKLTYRGKAMPVTLFYGPGLHGDYIVRRQDHEWPGDEKGVTTHLQARKMRSDPFDLAGTVSSSFTCSSSFASSSSLRSVARIC